MIERWWDLQTIVEFINGHDTSIHSVIWECNDYLGNKEDYYPILKQLQEIKRLYQKGLKFDTIKKRKPQYELCSIETIAECYQKGRWSIEEIKKTIEFEKKHMKNRKAVYRFKKRLLEAGLPQSFL